MEISKSDRDAYLDLLYDMYDADLVDVALETLGENELLDGIPACLKIIILTKIIRLIYNLIKTKKVQDQFNGKTADL